MSEDKKDDKKNDPDRRSGRFGALSGSGKVKLDDEVSIHTMPERTGGSAGSAKKEPAAPHQQAKKTGIMILVLGGLFLVAILAGLYYFLVMQGGFSAENPVQTPQTENNSQATKAAADTAAGKKPPAQPAEKAGDAQPAKEDPRDGTREEAEEPAEAEVGPATSTEDSLGPATSTEEQPAETVSARPQDSDADGLYDLEEMLLGCDAGLSDSDADGYGDMSELNNMYNPAGSGKLLANPYIDQYTNNKYKYTVYYPLSWSVNLISGGDTVIFKYADDGFMQIIAQENTDSLDIRDWYKRQFNVDNIDPASVMEGGGWTAVKKDDKYYYVGDSAYDNIYIFSYNYTGEKNSYVHIFETMLKSFKLN